MRVISGITDQLALTVKETSSDTRVQNRRCSLLVRERQVNDMKLEHQLLRSNVAIHSRANGLRSKQQENCLVYLGMRNCHAVCRGRVSALNGATQEEQVWDTAMNMGMHSSLHTLCRTAPIQAELG